MQMSEIKSKDSEKIKFLRKLQQKKYRDNEGKFLVENLKIIYDGLRAGIIPAEIFFTKNFLRKNLKEAGEISDKLKKGNVFLISEAINKSFSSLETAPGVCAVYNKKPQKINLEEIVIYLNGVNDPGNIGTILRSALAFGLKNVVLDEGCADIYNYKTIQAAKDSIFKLNITLDKELNIFDKIRKTMKIFSTSLEGDKELTILDKEKFFCLVLGSESHGVEKKILDKSDGFIKIRMSGDIESLNVAVSASIIFHHIFTQAIDRK